MNKAMNYGYALFDLATEEGLESLIQDEFSEINGILKNNHEFIQLLLNPRISVSEKNEVLDEIFKDKIHPYLLSILKILTENGDASLISLCSTEFSKCYYKEKNILLVTAISAVELNEDQKQRIISKLEKKMNKSIILENIVDQTCIGGIRLTYHGNMIDSSIKNRFEKLQNDLKNADYSQTEVWQ